MLKTNENAFAYPPSLGLPQLPPISDLKLRLAHIRRETSALKKLIRIAVEFGEGERAGRDNEVRRE